MLGHIEIGYVASAAFSGLLSSAMLAFRKERPRVMLRILEMETPRQLTAIAESKLDVGFIRPRPNYPEGVVVEVLRAEKLLLALPVGHPLSSGIEIGALADETFIVPQFEEAGGFAEHVADFAAAAGAPPSASSACVTSRRPSPWSARATGSHSCRKPCPRSLCPTSSTARSRTTTRRLDWP